MSYTVGNIYPYQWHDIPNETNTEVDIYYSVNNGTDWTLIERVNNTVFDVDTDDWNTYELTLTSDHVGTQVKLKAVGVTDGESTESEAFEVIAAPSDSVQAFNDSISNSCSLAM